MARLAAGGNALDTISWLGTFLLSCLACLTFSCTKSLCLPLSLSLSVGVKFVLLIAVEGILSLISLFLASFAKYYVYAYAALAAPQHANFAICWRFSCTGNEVEAAAEVAVLPQKGDVATGDVDAMTLWLNSVSSLI